MTISMADWPSEASEVTLIPWCVTDIDGSLFPGTRTLPIVRAAVRVKAPLLKSMFATCKPAAAPGHATGEETPPQGLLPPGVLSESHCQPKAESTFHTPKGQGGFPQDREGALTGPAEAELPCSGPQHPPPPAHRARAAWDGAWHPWRSCSSGAQDASTLSEQILFS